MTSVENPPADDPQDHPAGRVAGIETETHSLPKPVEHGATGQIVLNDCRRDAREIDFDAGEHTRLPDGSLYQTARAAFLAHDPEGQTAILDEDYRPDWFGEADPDAVAVTLTSSRWKAGTGEGDDYTPYYKYDLTLRPLDEDGAVDPQNTPIRSLTLKIRPQYDDLVYPDGSSLEIPFGEGTQLRISSTYVDEFDVLEERATELLDDVLDYQIHPFDVAAGSRKAWKLESYHRFDESRLDDLVSTIRQSQELIPHHGGDVRTGGEANGGKWTEIRVESDDWQHLGFPRVDVQAYLKVYYMDNPDAVEYPLDQPKVEAGVLGDSRFAPDEFDDVLEFLREIVLSHLHWAGLDETDLVGDHISDGAENPTHQWEHPQGRRTWLRDHYESFMPSLYRLANRERTLVTYDILQVLRERGSATYQELADRTGAAKRTVREHVRRLEGIGPDAEPGILQRKRGAVTLVTWSPAMREQAAEVLDESHPDDTARDRDQRREERRRRREDRQNQGDQEDVDDDQGDEDGRDEAWRRADRLARSPDELGEALQADLLDPVDVRVNISPYNWIADPDTG